MKSKFLHVFIALVIATGALLGSVSFVHAHGEDEEDDPQGLGGIGQTVNNYFIDVEYGEGNLVVKDPVSFTFKLIDKNTRDPIPVNEINLNIRHQDSNTVVFASRLAGNTNTQKDAFTYAFPRVGTYVITSRFIDANGDTIVETGIPLNIKKEPFEQLSTLSLLFLALGAVCGILLVLIGQEYTRKLMQSKRSRQKRRRSTNSFA